MGDDQVWNRHAAEPFCYLTTTGRRSGRRHTIEIWFAFEGATFFLISGGADRSDWVQNLLVDPGVGVRVGEDRAEAKARAPLPAGPERDTALAALHAKYGHQVTSTLEEWREGAYVVALDLVTPAG